MFFNLWIILLSAAPTLCKLIVLDSKAANATLRFSRLNLSISTLQSVRPLSLAYTLSIKPNRYTHDSICSTLPMSKQGGTKPTTTAPPPPPRPPAQDYDDEVDDYVDEAEELAEAYDEHGGRSGGGGGGGGGRKGSHGGNQERVNLHSGKGTRHKVELLEHARRNISPPPKGKGAAAGGKRDTKK